MSNQYSKNTIKTKLESKSQEIEILLISGSSLPEISREVGCTYGSLYGFIKRNNTLSKYVGVCNNGKSIASREYQKSSKWIEKEDLEREYNNGKTLYELAEQYGKTASGVLYTMRLYGLKTRTKGEASRLLYIVKPELREVHRKNAYEGKTGIHRKGVARTDTKIEKIFESFCVSHNIPYEKQYRIKNSGHRYDFCLDGRIIVEIDGVYWHSNEKQKMLDERHKKYAVDSGYSVYRFTDVEIRETNKGCFNGLLEII